MMKAVGTAINVEPNDTTAPWTSPFLLLLYQPSLNADVADTVQVLQDFVPVAKASIAGVGVHQFPVILPAGKFIALETEFQVLLTEAAGPDPTRPLALPLLVNILRTAAPAGSLK